MTLNKREQKIAWVVGGMLGLYILYAYVVTPLYLEPIRNVDAQIVAAQTKIKKDSDLINNQTNVRKDWDKLIQAGLDRDSTVVATHVYDRVYQMVRSYGLQMTSFKPDPIARNQKSDFAEIPFNLTVNCTSKSLSSLIWALETSGMPVRVENVTIQAVKPGEDNLNAEIKIHALLYRPREKTIEIAGLKAGTTRPAGTTGGMTMVSTSATPESTTLSTEDEAIAQRLRERRMREEGGGPAPAAGTQPVAAPAAAPTAPVAAPAATPGTAKTDEEIMAELRARRARDEGGAAPVTPTTQPAGGVR